MSEFLTPDTSLALMRAAQGESTKSASALKNLGTKDAQKINETAQEFEAVFLSEMLKPMFQGIETDGMFGGGKGEEVFRSFMLQEYGKIMSQTGGIGLADHVRDQIIQLQAAQDSPADIKILANTTNEEGSVDDTSIE
ncbi:MAG: rod-binding protein [Alphaproteobacteria bacterium]|nr:rod-binding protein [Alphaproteobacteria bacterium]